MQPLILDLQVDNAQAINSINAFFDIYEKGVDGMAQSLGQALGKPVEVGVHLKMEGDKIIADGVEKLDKSVQKVEASAKLMNGEFGKTPNMLKTQLQILKAIQGDTKKYQGDTKNVTAEWQALEQIIKKVQERLAEMSGAGDGDLTNKLIASQVAADALMGSFNLLKDAVVGFVRTGSEMEILYIQLQGFTGGVQEAADAYQRFVEIGQATPFSAKQVATAARTMMGFGINTEAAIDQTERLAIVASATGGELTHMARNMGQIQANQRAYTRDLMQFANQGIPIYQEMAKLLDVNTQTIREMAEEGQVGFGLVSAALRQLTDDGSAFKEIAELMDATFAAKFEAIESGMESFAGRMLGAINAFDAALGGPLANSLQGVINLLNGMASGLTWASQNMKTMAPIIAAVSAAMVTLVALTIKANWGAFSSAIYGVLVMTKAWAAGQTVLNTALAVGQALTGNIPALLLAAGVAAGGAAIAYNTLGKSVDKLTEAKERESFQTAKTIDDIDEKVFSMKTEIDTIQKVIDKEREKYNEAKEQMGIAKTKAERVIMYLEQELDAFKDKQKEERDIIKDKEREEKAGHSERMAAIREYYGEAIDKEKKLLNEIRERYALEREDIEEKTGAEQALENIRRRELELKARGIEYTRSAAEEAAIERLEAQAALDRMDRAVALEKNRAEEKKAVAKQEQEIKKLEGEKKVAEAAEKKFHEIRMAHFTARKQALDDELQAEKDKIEEARKKYEDMFVKIKGANFSSHEAAMGYLNKQIQEAKRLETAMVNAANRAKKAWEDAYKAEEKMKNKPIWEQNATKNADAWTGQGTPFANQQKRASGGPVSGGTKYTVNELGKEAFLSASGRLSMINAPSFGTWRAPSSGTVIPAHLTSQLDIPAGGVNISGNPGMNAAGSVNGLARAISGIQAGGNISNNVTIQSANPIQSANNMLVQLQKIRSTRLGRR